MLTDLLYVSHKQESTVLLVCDGAVNFAIELKRIRHA